MSSTRELRRRIRSIKNTSQITKAMEMVAGTKMRRAQMQALASRPYSQTLEEVWKRLSSKLTYRSHHLLSSPIEADKIGIFLISTDRTLCGALNSNLFRFTIQFCQQLGIDLLNPMDKRKVIFYTLGRQGRSFVRKLDLVLGADFPHHELIHFRHAAQIARLLVEDWQQGKLKEIFLLYPHFLSTLHQQPQSLKLLPLSIEPAPGANLNVEFKTEDLNIMLIEPDLTEVIDYLISHVIETRIFQALLESKASEHSARMIAMQNATNNALELLEELQLGFNQMRQETITKEILEISSAVAALESR